MIKYKTNQGFTLFEVAISMVIISFSVVTVLMLLPTGLKAQHHARQQIFASIMMQNISSWFVEPGGMGLNTRVEAKTPASNHYMRRGLHDLETVTDGTGLGLCPLPNEIVKRLDSDNDEISQLHAAGGRIYYTKASQNTLGSNNTIGGPPQTLIIGFIGQPQLNALPNHPCISWPYWDNHPMAPARWELDNWAINSRKDDPQSGPNWRGYNEFKALYDVFNSDIYPTGGCSYATWMEYKKRAIELIAAVNIPVTDSPSGPIPVRPQSYPSNGNDWASMSPDSFDPRPEWVWAVSHLAHAAAMVTAEFSDGAKTPSPEDIAYAKETYESCAAWVRRATDSNPYNWGVARHLSSATAWTFPLIQQAVFSPPFTHPMNGDICHRLISPIPVSHYGQARGKHDSRTWINEDQIVHGSYPTIPSSSNYYAIKNNWGDPSQFVITRPFDPSERMRQVVFWSVDWQRYVDFESLPSPEHDSSMCFKDTDGGLINSESWGNYLAEKSLYWKDEERKEVVGTQVTAGSQDGADGQDGARYKAGNFMGMWGADRNGNGTFTQGTLPTSVRMYATQIARFPIYDRILISDGRY